MQLAGRLQSCGTKHLSPSINLFLNPSLFLLIIFCNWLSSFKTLFLTSKKLLSQKRSFKLFIKKKKRKRKRFSQSANNRALQTNGPCCRRLNNSPFFYLYCFVSFVLLVVYLLSLLSFRICHELSSKLIPDLH